MKNIFALRVPRPCGIEIWAKILNPFRSLSMQDGNYQNRLQQSWHELLRYHLQVSSMSLSVCFISRSRLVTYSFQKWQEFYYMCCFYTVPWYLSLSGYLVASTYLRLAVGRKLGKKEALRSSLMELLCFDITAPSAKISLFSIIWGGQMINQIFSFLEKCYKKCQNLANNFPKPLNFFVFF